ncbi:hypothetical protein [Romboutsia sp. 1001285H_161024_C4]|uniref:hypothetical protein n=1 Tax=Romboutsia sp. 1001285H_161024_C4 TaxID=2787109 RepID=UPI0018997E5C|nr:hypothetical protein [Romboutsia sp. 1001285H_161024_C4]
MKQTEHDNLELLFKYLVSQFIKEGADEEEAEKEAEIVILENSNNLFGEHGLAYQLGAINFEYFCMYFLQDTFVPKENNAARELSVSHRKLWNTLSKMFIEDEFDKLTLVAPRGWAKTTVCDFALTMWLHCYKKSVYTLVCGRTESDATEFIAQMRQNFEENEFIISAFGNLLDIKNFTVNKLELELTNRTKIQAISSTSSMRGKKYNGSRPSCIIADDYQGKADIITEEARDKKFRTWEEDSKFAGDKAVFRNGKKIRQSTKFIVLGTILHSDCFMSRLLKKNEYEKILYRVCDFNVDEYFNSGLWLEFKKIYFNHKLKDPSAIAKEFYYQHEEDMQYETIWPDKFDCLETAIDYFENPVAFKQELQNDAENIGEKWFKSIRTVSRSEIEEHNFIKTMLLIDPASTSKTTSDYSAFLVGSLADNGFKYARWAELAKINARTEFDKYINHMIHLIKEYPDITHIYIEKNTFNGADANQLENKIKADQALRYRNLTIINEQQKKNKDDKISTIIPEINKGQIIFADEDDGFVSQILDFAGQQYSIHDDAPDITSEFANRIDNIKVPVKVSTLSRSVLF